MRQKDKFMKTITVGAAHNYRRVLYRELCRWIIPASITQMYVEGKCKTDYGYLDVQITKSKFSGAWKVVDYETNIGFFDAETFETWLNYPDKWLDI